MFTTFIACSDRIQAFKKKTWIPRSYWIRNCASKLPTGYLFVYECLHLQAFGLLKTSFLKHLFPIHLFSFQHRSLPVPRSAKGTTLFIIPCQNTYNMLFTAQPVYISIIFILCFVFILSASVKYAK